MSITNYKKVNEMCPQFKNASLGYELGTLLNRMPITIKYQIAADATGGLTAYTAEFPMEVVNAHVICTTANASGTVTLRKATSAISDAMICAVDKVVVNAGTIDDANSTLAKGDTLTVVANGAADRGMIIIEAIPAI